jgi:hypothetical protein
MGAWLESRYRCLILRHIPEDRGRCHCETKTRLWYASGGEGRQRPGIGARSPSMKRGRCQHRLQVAYGMTPAKTRWRVLAETAGPARIQPREASKVCK